MEGRWLWGCGGGGGGGRGRGLDGGDGGLKSRVENFDAQYEAVSVGEGEGKKVAKHS